MLLCRLRTLLYICSFIFASKDYRILSTRCLLSALTDGLSPPISAVTTVTDPTTRVSFVPNLCTICLRCRRFSFFGPCFLPDRTVLRATSDPQLPFPTMVAHVLNKALRHRIVFPWVTVTFLTSAGALPQNGKWPWAWARTRTCLEWEKGEARSQERFD